MSAFMGNIKAKVTVEVGRVCLMSSTGLGDMNVRVTVDVDMGLK